MPGHGLFFVEIQTPTTRPVIGRIAHYCIERGRSKKAIGLAQVTPNQPHIRLKAIENDPAGCPIT